MVEGEELLVVQQVELPGRGRGLVAAQGLRGGQIVLRDTPLLVYLVGGGAWEKYCSSCLRKIENGGNGGGGGGEVCGACRFARFCCSGCEGRHVENVCSALKEVAKSGFEAQVEAQARYLIAAYNVAVVAPDEFENLLALEGEAVVDEEVESLHAFVERLVVSWPWKSESRVGLAVTAGLLGKDARNAFGFMAHTDAVGERAVRGYGLFFKASFLNHDCLPNVCRFDYVDSAGEGNTDIVFRALHDDIPEKTELTISYFPINWPYAERQKRLQEEYKFHCTCERCLVEQNWSDSECSQGNLEHEQYAARLSSECKSADCTCFEGESEGSKCESELGMKEGDFEYAIYFLKYLCPVEDCGGTMAPLPKDLSGDSMDSSIDSQLFSTVECNMCGHLRTGEAFQEDLEEHEILVRSN